MAIGAELDGVFGSNAEILKRLENKSPDERHAIAQKYAELNGGPGAQSPEDFMLGKLSKELDGSEQAGALNLLGVSQARTPAEKSALELEALKAGLREDVAGWGTDEDRLFERLEKATPEQRQAVLADPATREVAPGRFLRRRTSPGRGACSRELRARPTRRSFAER